MIFTNNTHKDETRRTRVTVRSLWSIVIISILMLAAIALPLPYYIEAPGGADSTQAVLTVDHKKDEAPGSYNYVYITMRQATPLAMLLAGFNRTEDVYPKNEITGGASNKEYDAINQIQMQTSQNMAIYNGLILAKRPAKLVYKGVYVISIVEGSSIQGTIAVGDTVTAINGQTFASSQEMIDAIKQHPVGDTVTVTYLHDSQEKKAQATIHQLSNGTTGIGIGLVDHTEVESDIPITFHTKDLGGPSAGLMFTLSIYTQLADPDLRKGRVIAGTGTIEADGTVGPIGGVDKKVVSANKAGASIFFAPDTPIPGGGQTNYQEAVAVAKKEQLSLTVVPVKTAQEAIDYLKQTSST